MVQILELVWVDGWSPTYYLNVIIIRLELQHRKFKKNDSKGYCVSLLLMFLYSFVLILII